MRQENIFRIDLDVIKKRASISMTEVHTCSTLFSVSMRQENIFGIYLNVIKKRPSISTTEVYSILFSVSMRQENIFGIDFKAKGLNI